MKWNAKWIKPNHEHQDIAPVFSREFSVKKELKQAILKCTVLGVYEAQLNGHRIGEFYMAPGWTAYDHRLQVQSYDVTSLLKEENHCLMRSEAAGDADHYQEVAEALIKNLK